MVRASSLKELRDGIGVGLIAYGLADVLLLPPDSEHSPARPKRNTPFSKAHLSCYYSFGCLVILN